MNKLVNDIVDCIGTVPDTDCVALYNVDPTEPLPWFIPGTQVCYIKSDSAILALAEKM